MFPLNHQLLTAEAQLHGAELRREAQRNQLVHQICQGKASTLDHLVAHLGKLLVAAGTRLQRRTGAMLTPA